MTRPFTLGLSVLFVTLVLTATGVGSYLSFFWYVLGDDFKLATFIPYILISGFVLSAFGVVLEVVFRHRMGKSLFYSPGRLTGIVILAYAVYRTLSYFLGESSYLIDLNQALGFNHRHPLSYVASIGAVSIVAIQNTFLGYVFSQLAERFNIIPKV